MRKAHQKFKPFDEPRVWITLECRVDKIFDSFNDKPKAVPNRTDNPVIYDENFNTKIPQP